MFGFVTLCYVFGSFYMFIEMRTCLLGAALGGEHADEMIKCLQNPPVCFPSPIITPDDDFAMS